MKDLYGVLGVKKDATSEEIKVAYYVKAKDLHPDKNEGKESQDFIDVATAYEILSNEETRKYYDETGGVKNSPQSVESIVRGVIAAWFTALIRQGQLNVETNDILQILKNQAGNKRSEVEQLLKQAEMLDARMSIIEGRLEGKTDFFKELIALEKEGNERLMQTLKNELELGNKIEEYLDECTYKVDKVEPTARPTIRTFTINGF